MMIIENYQATSSGTQSDEYTPYYGWHDPEGKYEGWTSKEREKEWERQIKVIRKKTQERDDDE